MCIHVCCFVAAKSKCKSRYTISMFFRSDHKIYPIATIFVHRWYCVVQRRSTVASEMSVRAKERENFKKIRKFEICRLFCVSVKAQTEWNVLSTMNPSHAHTHTRENTKWNSVINEVRAFTLFFFSLIQKSNESFLFDVCMHKNCMFHCLSALVVECVSVCLCRLVWWPRETLLKMRCSRLSSLKRQIQPENGLRKIVQLVQSSDDPVWCKRKMK